MERLSVNGERLWATLMETARFGGTPGGGITRLPVTDADRDVRDWFVEACKAIECSVTVDEMGNIFARRQGQDASLSPISFGSHLDTQAAGGKFDGTAGVLSGLEVMRTLHEAGFQTRAPLELINWTAEEGGRFPPLFGSGVFAGAYERDWAYNSKDPEGIRFLDELERVGYRGKEGTPGHKLGAYFEIHIEQGPVLESEDKVIGVVVGARGQLWYDVVVTGLQGHAGTTPMAMRKDAMTTFTRIAGEVFGLAWAHAPEGLATIGHVEVIPNSRNVIPGAVSFTIDLRHSDKSLLHRMDDELGALVDKIAAGSETVVSLKKFWTVEPMDFDSKCVAAVRTAAQQFGYSHMDIVTGPGHDALQVARVAPTAMIFIPCEHGISHNEAENVKPEHVTAGANVLLNAVLECAG
ncbi:MAG: Zn-dependent hydrolase [Dehalococcoidia bacterium]|nr:MAG: Zn-dependent hydrolase [Dehalococcoidia bacterium]